MIINLTVPNPFGYKDSYLLTIYYPNVDYIFWRRCKNIKNDNYLCNHLNELLNGLDCTKEFKNQRICMTNYPIYEIKLSEYYYYLLKFNNQFLYNIYIDKLLNVHINNIIYENNNLIIIPNKNNNCKNKSKIKNKYIKQEVKDLFNDKISYIYINYKTNDRIESDNPNLLNILNNKSKINKNNKTTIKNKNIIMKSMMFNVKKQ